jgi:hypothetical protein
MSLSPGLGEKYFSYFGFVPITSMVGLRSSACRGMPLELFPRGTHDDLFDHGAWDKTRTFLASLGGQRQR